MTVDFRKLQCQDREEMVCVEVYATTQGTALIVVWGLNCKSDTSIIPKLTFYFVVMNHSKVVQHFSDTCMLNYMYIFNAIETNIM